jgi:ATP-dependent protease ClpP protease subunit
MSKPALRNQTQEDARDWATILDEYVAAEKIIHAGLRARSEPTSLDCIGVTVFAFGSIDQKLAHAITAELHKRPHAEHITLRLHSSGGCVRSAYMIIGALRGHGAKVRALATQAGSAALQIVLACHERVAHPRGEFLHHKSQGGTARSRDEIAVIKNKLFADVGVTSPAVTALLKDLGEAGRSFSAADALAIGVATRVENFRLIDAPEKFGGGELRRMRREKREAAEALERAKLVAESRERRRDRQLAAGARVKPVYAETPVGYRWRGDGANRRMMPIWG